MAPKTTSKSDQKRIQKWIENLKDAFVSLVFFFMFMISLLEILFIKGGVTVFRNSFRIFKLLRKAKPERFAEEIRRALAQPN